MRSTVLTKIFLQSIWFLGLVNCGGSQTERSERSSDAATIVVSCDLQPTEATASLGGLPICIDYSNVEAGDISKLQQDCESTAGYQSNFSSDKSCPGEDALGGCRINTPSGLITTSWIFSTGDEGSDSTIVELSRDDCETDDDARWVSADLE